MQLRLSELFIAKEEGRSTIRIFTSLPTPLEEKNLGRLFIIMEIDSKDSINDDILDLISEEINAHYYRSESFEVEAAFENALQKTNQKLQELIGEIGEEWLENINVLVGVEKAGVVYFTNLGRVVALMIYKDTIVDILDTTKSKSQSINPVKVFNNIVSGEIKEGSIILFGTETILNYLSKEKIKRILKSHKDEEAIEKFTSLLEEDTTNTNFAALIVSRERIGAEDAALFNNETISDDEEKLEEEKDSMSQLMNQQQKTASLLTSSVWPGIKNSVSNYFANGSNDNDNGTVQAKARTNDHARFQHTSAPSSDLKGAAQQLGKEMGRAAGKGLLVMLRVSKNFIVQGAKGTVIFIQQARGKNTISYSKPQRRGYRPSRKAISGKATNVFARAINAFRALTTVQKAFFILAIVFIVIFAQLIVNKGEERITKEGEEEYAQMISDIDLKINEGKAAILYDNEKAAVLFFEARDMLNQIPQQSKVYKERGEELQEVISRQLLRANNVITLNDPKAVLDYSTINSEIKISHVILLGASMYGFDENNGSVYRGNLENGQTSVTISDAGGEQSVVEVTKASPGTGAAVLKNGHYVTFNPIDESFKNLDLKYGEAERNIVDIAVFGTRLYTLDRASNQIYRHLKTGEEFEAGSAWISGEGVDLSNAVSFAIDGDIYVLKENGELIRMSAGTKDEEFSIAKIDPSLDSAKSIFTNENIENLYIVDSAHKRIVVFTKEGKLVAQYTSDTFDGLKDIVVDEANKKLYVLSGTKLYEVELQDAPVPTEEGGSGDTEQTDQNTDSTAQQPTKPRLT